MNAVEVEIFRSTRSAECEERAFVLTAVGIPYTIVSDGAHCSLFVDAALASQAAAHLRQYEAEKAPARPRPSPDAPYPHAWLGSAIYALVLLIVTFAISQGLWRLDAFETGALVAQRVQAGEWWRAWTALTLHVDGAHLIANLGAGIWFGWIAGQRLGPGTAWLLIVTGAAASNLLESLLASPAHRAVGASTAVFTALGLLSAHAWRERYRLPQRWAMRWGPLVAGIVLLGWLGSSGEDTDLVAHVSGFIVGTVLGAVAARRRVRDLLRRVPQWISGALAVGSILGAWIYALTSPPL